jgi:hypothetical protein
MVTAAVMLSPVCFASSSTSRYVSGFLMLRAHFDLPLPYQISPFTRCDMVYTDERPIRLRTPNQLVLVLAHGSCRK